MEQLSAPSPFKAGGVVYWRLREILEDRGMSRYELVRLSGLHIATVYRAAEQDAEVGRVDGGTLDRFCEVLGVGPGDLLQYVPGKRRERKPRRKS